jgi:hypothetical protein
MTVRNLIILVARFIGFYPSKLSENGIKAVLELLKPVDNGHHLIRIGGPKDGGYLLPEDLIGVEACFSPGVASNWSFENDLFQKFTIPSVMYDASVDRPIDLPDIHVFYKQFIGASTFKNYKSIADVVNIDLEKYPGDLIAQIDIEGGEYPLLNSISLDILIRFRVLVVEMHELDRWIDKRYFHEIVSPILQKIATTHDLVHSHVNNNGGTFRYRSYKAPKVIELTWHRKDRAIKYGGFRKIPNLLDSDNV